MKYSTHDEAVAVAVEHLAWLRAQVPPPSIGDAAEALPDAHRIGVRTWDDLCFAFARAWLESARSAP